MRLFEMLPRRSPRHHALLVPATFLALSCAGGPGLLAGDDEPTVLSHFMEETTSFDYSSRDNGLGHLLRIDLDVTGDGVAEVFLAPGPTGRAGTYWNVYSPGQSGRYNSLGRIFFHPGAFCFDPEERLFLLSQRVEPHEHVVAGYRFSQSGAEWVRSSRQVSDLETPFPPELQDLSSCPTETEVLMATPFDAAHGLQAWLGLQSHQLVDPQPPRLVDLPLSPGKH